MSKRDLRLYVEDILESITAIESYISGINNFDDFATDRKTYSATIREYIISHKIFWSQTFDVDKFN